MALSFNDQKGGAAKAEYASFKYIDGDNVFRIVGDILPRYVYWVKGADGMSLPVECLEFNRDTEKFDRAEKDWVKVFFPDQKCGWAYVTQCIDPEDGTIKILHLKKKMWAQIMDIAAEGLGDPTDPETGWDIHVKRKKTGVHNFNVEYQVSALACQKGKRPLTAEEKALVAEMSPIDEVIPRPTPEAQKDFLERLSRGTTSDNVDEEVVNKEFNEADLA